jgi:threonine/homoserine/homoserine lactone efflux protein
MFLTYQEEGMSPEILLALAGYSLVSSITPGPNNLMLLTSGVNFGFRRTIPHMIGVSGGFAILLVCLGLGLGQILLASPMLFNAIKVGGAAYLVYLAYRIARSGPIELEIGEARPMSFLQAAAFQWVNPKAWVMGVTAMAVYASAEQYLTSVAVIVLVFTAVNLPSVSVWCGMGAALRSFLANRRRLQIFNLCMASLLVLSLWPLLA